MIDRQRSPVVRLLVCGNADRGDDGVAFLAAAGLLSDLPVEVADRLDVRRCPELRTEDLLDLPDAACALIVDAVAGPPPGRVVRLTLDALSTQPPFTPRSSHQLPIDLVVGLAGALRGRPVDGSFVGIAGAHFGLGTSLSDEVRAGLPALRRAIADELANLVAASPIRIEA
jgi:hydrogenase maturation protease